MTHFHLSSYPERAGAHYSVGVSPPFDYSKNPSVVKEFGKKKASKLKGKGFVLVQLQDERAEQVRCRLTTDEARHMADELRRFAAEVEGQRATLGMNPAPRNKCERRERNRRRTRR
jgi:hypothetical protein